MYIVELENGVWLAEGIGDPPITPFKENAKKFSRKNHAKYGLKIARKYRPFLRANISKIANSKP